MDILRPTRIAQDRRAALERDPATRHSPAYRFVGRAGLLRLRHFGTKPGTPIPADLAPFVATSVFDRVPLLPDLDRIVGDLDARGEGTDVIPPIAVLSEPEPGLGLRRQVPAPLRP